VRAYPGHEFADEDFLIRYGNICGDERIFAEGLLPSFREKLSRLFRNMVIHPSGSLREWGRHIATWRDPSCQYF
jgi:hypothetical protein